MVNVLESKWETRDYDLSFQAIPWTPPRKYGTFDGIRKGGRWLITSDLFVSGFGLEQSGNFPSRCFQPNP